MGLSSRNQRISVRRAAAIAEMVTSSSSSDGEMESISSSEQELQQQQQQRGGGYEPSPVYRDFAHDTTESIVRAVEPPKAKRKGPRGGVTTPFPVRLFDMLQASLSQNFEDVCSWQSHGRSFVVRKPAVFEQEILPKFFAQTKMSSFQRQLNLYGFLRQNTGRDRGSYYHELFLRSRPDLPKFMLRTRVKGIGMGRTNKVEKEPDFYQMPPCLAQTAEEIKSSLEQETRTTSYNDHHHQADNDVVEPIVAQNISSDRLSIVSNHSQQQQQQQVFPTQSSWLNDVDSTDPARVSPSYHAAVSPEDSGRPLFVASRRTDPTNYQQQQQHYVSQPVQRVVSNNGNNMDDFQLFDNNGHHVDCHPPVWEGALSVIPAVSPNPIGLSSIPYLQPRFAMNSNNNNMSEHLYQAEPTEYQQDDMALFEGLEFQIVDEDSLEQFESDLIPDSVSSVSKERTT